MTSDARTLYLAREGDGFVWLCERCRAGLYRPERFVPIATSFTDHCAECDYHRDAYGVYGVIRDGECSACRRQHGSV